MCGGRACYRRVDPRILPVGNKGKRRDVARAGDAQPSGGGLSTVNGALVATGGAMSNFSLGEEVLRDAEHEGFRRHLRDIAEREPVQLGEGLRPEIVERTANVLLFSPLGLLLGVVLASPWRAAVVLIAASVAVESLQLALPDRTASGWDILTNSLGAVPGAALARRLIDC